MTSLHFAQISDIHISSLGDHHDLLSGQAADFLANICGQLNRRDDLDFVLITGDLFDTASHQEFDRFQEAIKTLQKPYYVIPGNHDRRSPESDSGLTHYDFARHFNPQIEARSTSAMTQMGYWSINLDPKVQLIGLDSIKDDDWSGVVDVAQLEWLKDELKAQADKLIILAVHHPLHTLSPIDELPRWYKFVCDNSGEIMALLDRHPQVKIVLTGHHHLSKADLVNGRLHLACPAISIYPCAYRTLQLTQNLDSTWTFTWQTYPATNETTISTAQQRMTAAWAEVGFEADFIEEHVNLALGTAWDRQGQVILR